MNPDWCSRLHFFCRLAAERLTNRAPVAAPYYVDHERAGYVFSMPDRLSAIRLAIYYQHLLKGRAYRLAPVYP
jgi:hypothetical protein